jgi:hypothetical protein
MLFTLYSVTRRNRVIAGVRHQSIECNMEIQLLPKSGELRSTVFENVHAGIARSVFFNVLIPIAPFDFEGQSVETSVRLDLIDFGVTDWRLLSDKSFAFPVNPAEGYVDGSMYLGHAHNPADVTRIAFGRFADSSVEVVFDIAFDFTYEGPSRLGKPSYTWTIVLNFDPIALDATLREFQVPTNRRTKN